MRSTAQPTILKIPTQLTRHIRGSWPTVHRTHTTRARLRPASTTSTPLMRHRTRMNHHTRCITSHPLVDTPILQHSSHQTIMLQKAATKTRFMRRTTFSSTRKRRSRRRSGRQSSRPRRRLFSSVMAQSAGLRSALDRQRSISL
jgi:hypothetical protein